MFIHINSLCVESAARRGLASERPAGNRQRGALVFECSCILIPYVWNLRPGRAWEAPQAPDAPEVPEATEAPEAPEAPDAPEAPEAPEAPRLH